MILLESPGHDPYFNLALEQHIFDKMDRRNEYFMLWQNESSVIVGKNQNTYAEIDRAFIDANSIPVVRRLSGGGAVYHDLGNVNYTFVSDCAGDSAFDFSRFYSPVLKTLEKLGVRASKRGRNDIVIGGEKFSGNAQYSKQGRVLHHGTLLFDTDLEKMRRSLMPPEGVLSSKAIASVRSGVTNIKPHLAKRLDVAGFIGLLREAVSEEFSLETRPLAASDIRSVEALRDGTYSKWEWNYGSSPQSDTMKQRRIEGCGTVQVHYTAKNGRISSVAFYGDYFGNGDATVPAGLLIGRKLEEQDLLDALAGIDVGEYFHNLDAKTLVDIVLR